VTAKPDPRDVFVNCPFDSTYNPLFQAIVFTVVRSGFFVRCAAEADDAGENRFVKICRIINECRYGIHDLSRTESNGDPPLPRFNMPLELGLFLGARHYGNKANKSKKCIIFDRDKYRFHRFISDIAGQDIHSHNDSESELIKELASWLRLLQSGPTEVPGGMAIAGEFAGFMRRLPAICEKRRLELDELTFSDFYNIVIEDIKAVAVVAEKYSDTDTFFPATIGG
jgi:hypothetical protein